MWGFAVDSFKAEWGALVSQAQAGQHTRMQLNSAAPAGGGDTGPGGADRLASDPAAKKASAKYVDEELLPHLRSAGAMAGQPSEDPAPGMLGSERAQPGGTMQDWQAWQGVEHVLRQWGKQVRNLEQRLQGERDALRGVRVLFQSRDGLVHDSLLAGSDPSYLPTLPGNEPTGMRPAG
ncbi:hypothetical protein [Streptomyces reniochalinae]|uniref:Uncharacterized protein n=1 Tax=Streptomyces reniochalinae TaxID=2250578 RepID=A0A367E686_9ACTN|nr:hypothetical protein [Streptomyces reniochalinae]RCG13269.1 hypothetical protein DQ392_33755 [Streptomyces reniochalinae]